MRSEVGRVLACAAIAVLLLAHTATAQDSSSSSTGEESSSTAEMSSSSTGTNSTSRFNFNITNVLRPRDFPNDTVTFCGTTDQGAMRVYDNTTICIVVGGIAKIYFYVNVDEYSLMQIVVPIGPNTTGAFDNQTMWFQAEYSTARSPAKYYHPQVAGMDAYVVPFYTLLITLKDGFVDKMEWDDGCLGCSGDACVMDQCSVDRDEVGCRSATSNADCNPKFFIGWFGTDRDGMYLTSAGSRYSRFRSYSLTSAFNEAYQTASVEIKPVQGITFTPGCGNDAAQCEQN